MWYKQVQNFLDNYDNIANIEIAQTINFGFKRLIELIIEHYNDEENVYGRMISIIPQPMSYGEVAFTGKHSETVAMFLDSGNTHCTDHYDDLLNTIISKYKEPLYNGNLILRIDSRYGSTDNVEKLKAILNLKFVTKGYSTKTASNLAQGIDYSEYIQADDAAWVYELPEIDGVRYIIV